MVCACAGGAAISLPELGSCSLRLESWLLTPSAPLPKGLLPPTHFAVHSWCSSGSTSGAASCCLWQASTGSPSAAGPTCELLRPSGALKDGAWGSLRPAGQATAVLNPAHGVCGAGTTAAQQQRRPPSAHVASAPCALLAPGCCRAVLVFNHPSYVDAAGRCSCLCAALLLLLALTTAAACSGTAAELRYKQGQ